MKTSFLNTYLIEKKLKTVRSISNYEKSPIFSLENTQFPIKSQQKTLNYFVEILKNKQKAFETIKSSSFLGKSGVLNTEKDRKSVLGFERKRQILSQITAREENNNDFNGNKRLSFTNREGFCRTQVCLEENLEKFERNRRTLKDFERNKVEKKEFCWGKTVEMLKRNIDRCGYRENYEKTMVDDRENKEKEKGCAYNEKIWKEEVYHEKEYEKMIAPREKFSIIGEKSAMIKEKLDLLQAKPLVIKEKSNLLKMNEKSLTNIEKSLIINEKSLRNNEKSLIHNEKFLINNEISLINNERSLISHERSLITNEKSLINLEKSNKQSSFPDEKSRVINEKGSFENFFNRKYLKDEKPQKLKERSLQEKRHSNDTFYDEMPYRNIKNDISDEKSIEKLHETLKEITKKQEKTLYEEKFEGNLEKLMKIEKTMKNSKFENGEKSDETEKTAKKSEKFERFFLGFDRKAEKSEKNNEKFIKIQEKLNEMQKKFQKTKKNSFFNEKIMKNEGFIKGIEDFRKFFQGKARISKKIALQTLMLWFYRVKYRENEKKLTYFSYVYQKLKKKTMFFVFLKLKYSFKTSFFIKKHKLKENKENINKNEENIFRNEEKIMRYEEKQMKIEENSSGYLINFAQEVVLQNSPEFNRKKGLFERKNWELENTKMAEKPKISIEIDDFEEISFEDKENLSFSVKSPRKNEENEKKAGFLKKKINQRLEKECLKGKSRKMVVYK